MKTPHIVLVVVAFLFVIIVYNSFNNNKETGNKPISDGHEMDSVGVEAPPDEEYSSNNEEDMPKTGYINDLYAAAVYKGFEGIGFKLTKKLSEGFVFCDLKTTDQVCEVRIALDGAPDKIVEIRGAFTYYGNGNTNKYASQFLGYLATIGYENNMASEARQWVEDNISKNAKKDFNGVTFQIFANSPRVRTLLISPTP